MEELKRVLKDHAGKYPGMKPADAVKLIYQNEFGGGHMISDVDACMEYLHREYHTVIQSHSVPAWEDIGNGIVRVNLVGISPQQVEYLGQAFIISAQTHKGTMENFLKKLSLLRDLAEQGMFGFSLEELEAYLTEYMAVGCPAVSHSEAYRTAYRPAYRVVRKEFLQKLFSAEVDA